MGKSILVFTVVLLLSSCNNDNSKPKTKEISSVTVAEMTLENTVSITIQDKDRQTLALGSGVVVGDGKVVTNVHVIAGASYGYVQKTNSKDKLNIAGYFSIDKNNDVALLSVPEAKTKSKISINTKFPKVGEKIYAAGNPQGLSGTFTEGNVSAIREVEGNSLIQISAPISPGSSGGAIVNSDGELVGIAVGGIENGQNLNFAIPTIYIDSLIKNCGTEIHSLNIPEQIVASKKKIRNASDFVMVKNILWYNECDKFYSDQSNNPIVEFSIYNNTSEPIENIKIFLLVYDSDSLPVDYQIITTNEAFGSILPGLAKKVENINCSYGDYLGWEAGRTGTVRVSKKKGYKALFRVLDYKIVK